jgi:hypothetical protein
MAREGNNPGKVQAGNRYTQRITKLPGAFQAGVREHLGEVLAGTGTPNEFPGFPKNSGLW